MRFGFRSFARDERGAALPEYALLLFAVLIGSASAVKKIGPRIFQAGDVTTRLLSGEDVSVRASLGGAMGGGSFGSSGGANGSGGGSGSSAATSGGSFGGGAFGGGSSSSGGSAAGNGGSSSGGTSSGSSGSAATGGGSGFGGSAGSNGGSSAGAASGSSGSGTTGGGGFLGGSSTESYGGETANNAGTSTTDDYPPGFLGGTGAPPRTNSQAATPGGISSLGSSKTAQNTVNPPPPGNGSASNGSGSGSAGNAPGETKGDGYTISAAGEEQMQTLLAQAKKNADGKRPKGWCYKQVKEDIAEVGYGKIAKQGDTSQLKPLPGADQGYAHDFADYMNAKGANGQTNASNLGLQKLPITNPYDAPAGSIIVVRAGTPGTRNPVAGDIVVAGGGGKFYNDGNMGYGGSKNFPKGNTYVLGIYAPK